MNSIRIFEHWLTKEKYGERTIREHLASISRLMRWAEQEGYSSIDHLTYTEILHWVQQEKQRNINPATLNIQLNSLRLYYECLKEEGTREDNPAKRIRLKGVTKKVVQDVLDYKDLEALYHQYVKYTRETPVLSHFQPLARQRNIVVLGLLLWQGITSKELSALRTTHLDLQTGSIEIPGTARSNSRILSLAPVQIIPLNEYLNELNPQEEKLFNLNIDQMLTRLMQELKGLNPLIRNAGHLRASVLMHWLKLYEKRQVQYMAGHRHISSTEQYERQDMDKLTDQLTKYHPFG